VHKAVRCIADCEESIVAEHFAHDVFISYAHADREAAIALEKAFKAADLTVWRDDRLADAPAENLIFRSTMRSPPPARSLSCGRRFPLARRGCWEKPSGRNCSARSFR
jgi:hypothetical protein